MNHLPHDLIKKYNEYKIKINKNNEKINLIGNALSLTDSDQFQELNLSLAVCFEVGSSTVGNLSINKYLSVDVMLHIVNGIKHENKPMIEFCEKFEAAVAGAYAKEQGEEPPQVEADKCHPVARCR